MKFGDDGLLEQANEESRRDVVLAKLERELKFERSKGLLQADYDRIKQIHAEIADLQQKPKVPTFGALIVLAMILIVLALLA